MTKHIILSLAVMAAFLPSSAAAKPPAGFTSEERELTRSIESKLEGAALVRWGVIFGPLVSGLADGAAGGAEAIAQSDWKQLKNALQAIDRVAACRIVDEIDFLYELDGENTSAAGRKYYAHARSAFDRDCQ